MTTNIEIYKLPLIPPPSRPTLWFYPNPWSILYSLVYSILPSLFYTPWFILRTGSILRPGSILLPGSI